MCSLETFACQMMAAKEICLIVFVVAYLSSEVSREMFLEIGGNLKIYTQKCFMESSVTQYLFKISLNKTYCQLANSALPH
jgi:hypothetical protein